MEGEISSPAIKPINKSVIHRICSGQVILDLPSAVKELVENSLDAGASSIEVNLKEHGEEYFKVIDNGCGISPSNFQALARKHHTSKIADFSDLHSLTTFGFRGEALSSLCALGNLTIETRTKDEPIGTCLTYEYSGAVKTEWKTARQVGTTVTVEKLFSTLPVRSKEFSRNIRREYGKLISLLNAYAIMAKGVRLLCTNTSGRNLKSVVLKTQGSSSLKDNIITVFGLNTFQCLEPVSLCISEGCKVEGYLSKSGYGCGRNTGDRQYFYINGRPVDMPKVSKLVNELYKSSNSKQYPIAIMNFLIPTTSYDVNVTPDKRKVFFSDESTFVVSLREAIEKMYSPNQCRFSVNGIVEVNKEEDDPDPDAYNEDEDHHLAPKSPSPEGDGLSDCSGELLADDNSLKMPQLHSQDLCEEKEVVSRDEISPSKDLIVNAFVAKTCESLSAFRYKKSESLFMSSAITHQKSSTLEGSQKKDTPKFVQSSLANFVTMNKRKHENSSNVLSEVPVLRNEAPSCLVTKTSLGTHVLNSESKSCKVSMDDLPKANSEKLLKHYKPSSVSSTVETHHLDEYEVNNSESDQEELEVQEAPLSPADAAVESSSGKDQEMISGEMPGLSLMSESRDVIGDTLKPCSRNITYSPFQFSIGDLRKRRNKKLSGSVSNCFTHNGKNRRRYTAATLEHSQFENGEGSIHSLAAATIELERFFSKEDFGRMQVVGQFNLGFIIGKLDQDLFIVDQHAADEKCNFEKLSESTVMHLQPLLQPIRLELSPEEEVVVSMHMGIIRKNGFALKEDMVAPPGQRFLLKAVPFSKNITFGIEDLKDLISTLNDSQGECSIISSYKSDTSDSVCPSRVRAMLASRACRTSVTVGDALSQTEMQNILHNLAGLKSPWNCPHGRPTMRHLADLSSLRMEDQKWNDIQAPKW